METRPLAASPIAAGRRALAATLRAAPLAATAAVAGLALAGCAGAGGSASPEELLTDAASVLEETTSVHFVLTSENVPEGGTALLGGEGDAARPDQFAGSLDIALAGTSATVEVVSVDGVVYAQLPFASTFTETDPAALGIADPGTLLATDSGVTRLLTEATEPTAGEDARVSETVVRQVEVQLPAEVVGAVLGAAEGAGPFEAVLGIDPDSGQLRTAEITGEFLATDSDSTYLIELSDYDEPVEITAPVG